MRNPERSSHSSPAPALWNWLWRKATRPGGCGRAWELQSASAVGLWSVLTLASGFAWSFWSLVVLRLGVGVGEATCAPTASSLIGDLVPAQRRARALAVFMLGLPLGLALSFLVSGTIAERY